MAQPNNEPHFSGSVKGLHWLLFLLVVLQFISAFSLGAFAKGSAAASAVFTMHTSSGLAILVVGVLFVIAHFSSPRPSLAHIQPWQRNLARVVHVILFIAVILQPLLGMGILMAGGHSVSFLGLISIPPLFPESESAGGVLETLHPWVGWVILCAAFLHIVGALYHHFIAKDNILRRMKSGRTRG